MYFIIIITKHIKCIDLTPTQANYFLAFWVCIAL